MFCSYSSFNIWSLNYKVPSTHCLLCTVVCCVYICVFRLTRLAVRWTVPSGVCGWLGLSGSWLRYTTLTYQQWQPKETYKRKKVKRIEIKMFTKNKILRRLNSFCCVAFIHCEPSTQLEEERRKKSACPSVYSHLSHHQSSKFIAFALSSTSWARKVTQRHSQGSSSSAQINKYSSTSKSNKINILVFKRDILTTFW